MGDGWCRGGDWGCEGAEGRREAAQFPGGPSCMDVQGTLLSKHVHVAFWWDTVSAALFQQSVATRDTSNGQAALVEKGIHFVWSPNQPP